jgi:hypothetical protein
MSAEAAQALAFRWRQLAWICRMGNQDVYRLLGRDPMTEPLTELELAVFGAVLQELWEDEIQPRAEANVARAFLGGAVRSCADD